MNKQIQRTVGLTLIILMWTSCYNNSHIRTQRVLKSGDHVISGHGSFTLIAPDIPQESSAIRYNGIGGLGLGVSYLGFHRGLEQGIDVGLAGREGLFESFTLGLDLTKVEVNTGRRPYRYGLYLRSNFILNEADIELTGGSVFQVRPYLMTITSETRNWYGGVHGLLSFGSLTTTADHDNYILEQGDKYSRIEYNVSSLGMGVSLGNERRSGNLMLQSQLDITILNQRHNLRDNYITSNDERFSPLNLTGPIIGVSIAIHKAPQSSPPTVGFSRVSPFISKVISKPGQQQSRIIFDPLTGQAISSRAVPLKVQYDPLTGKRIQIINNSPQYDPNTGRLIEEPVHPEMESTNSLLTPEQQSDLMIKKLKIIDLNGETFQALIMDMTNQGLVIFRIPHEYTQPDTITFAEIHSIQLAGERKGFKGALKSGLTSCATCIGLPLVISSLMNEGDFFFIGLLAGPPVILGSMIHGALDRDTYQFTFNRKNDLPEISDDYKLILQQLILHYIESGFPDKQPSHAGR